MFPNSHQQDEQTAEIFYQLELIYGNYRSKEGMAPGNALVRSILEVHETWTSEMLDREFAECAGVWARKHITENVGG